MVRRNIVCEASVYVYISSWWLTVSAYLNSSTVLFRVHLAFIQFDLVLFYLSHQGLQKSRYWIKHWSVLHHLEEFVNISVVSHRLLCKLFWQSSAVRLLGLRVLLFFGGLLYPADERAVAFSVMLQHRTQHFQICLPVEQYALCYNLEYYWKYW